MEHTYMEIPVVKFSIGDDDEGWHEAENPRDFQASVALLQKLRDDDPSVIYTMFAEVGA